jgi:serine/threonine-protein kinase
VVARAWSGERSIEREGRRAATLTSTGIPAVHDLGVEDDLPYLVMELIPGESLADRLRREGPLAVTTAVELAAAAADAVDAVHRAGVVHRDVKPANLLLGDDGRVRVTDFGIAERTAAGLGAAEEVVSLGTVQYVAPERARGGDPDPAADVYALGIVAYELLAGRPPFDGEPDAVLRAHVAALPPPLPETVPAGIRAAVVHALHKDPAARPPSAAAFARELRRGLPASTDDAVTTVLPTTGGPTGTTLLPLPAMADPGGQPPRQGRRRRGLVLPVLFGVVLLTVVVLAFAATGDDPTPPPDPVPSVPSLDPAPPLTELDSVPEGPSVVEDPAPPPPERDGGGNGNGNGRGGGNGNGRGGRGG